MLAACRGDAVVPVKGWSHETFSEVKEENFDLVSPQSLIKVKVMMFSR